LSQAPPAQNAAFAQQRRPRHSVDQARVQVSRFRAYTRRSDGCALQPGAYDDAPPAPSLARAASAGYVAPSARTRTAPAPSSYASPPPSSYASPPAASYGHPSSYSHSAYTQPSLPSPLNLQPGQLVSGAPLAAGLLRQFASSPPPPVPAFVDKPRSLRRTSTAKQRPPLPGEPPTPEGQYAPSRAVSPRQSQSQAQPQNAFALPPGAMPPGAQPPFGHASSPPPPQPGYQGYGPGPGQGYAPGPGPGPGAGPVRGKPRIFVDDGDDGAPTPMPNSMGGAEYFAHAYRQDGPASEGHTPISPAYDGRAPTQDGRAPGRTSLAPSQDGRRPPQDGPTSPSYDGRTPISPAQDGRAPAYNGRTSLSGSRAPSQDGRRSVQDARAPAEDAPPAMPRTLSYGRPPSQDGRRASQDARPMPPPMSRAPSSRDRGPYPQPSHRASSAAAPPRVQLHAPTAYTPSSSGDFFGAPPPVPPPRSPARPTAAPKARVHANDEFSDASSEASAHTAPDVPAVVHEPTVPNVERAPAGARRFQLSDSGPVPSAPPAFPVSPALQSHALGIPGVALRPTSAGEFLASFAEACGDPPASAGGVPPLGRMSVAPPREPQPAPGGVGGLVRRLTRRGSERERPDDSADSGGVDGSDREGREQKRPGGVLRALSLTRRGSGRESPAPSPGLMRRFSRGKRTESVGPVAAPAPAPADSHARAVALVADMRAEEDELAPPPAEAHRHRLHKPHPHEAGAPHSHDVSAPPPEDAAPRPYPLLEHVGEPVLLAGMLAYLSYGDWAALLRVCRGVRERVRTRRASAEVVLAKFLGPVGYRAWTPGGLPEPLALTIDVRASSRPAHTGGG
jgi:hypothetical protein